MAEKIKIYIRPLRFEDAEVSWKWRNNPNIWKYTGRRPDRYISADMEKAWISKVLADASSRRFAICVSETDQYIGNVQLTDIDEDKKMAQFHIFVGEEKYWGCGVGSQATKLLVDYAFQQLHLSILQLKCNTENEAAVRLYRKAGFVEVCREQSEITMICRFSQSID